MGDPLRCFRQRQVEIAVSRGKRVTAEPQSVLILGHRADCPASRNGIVHIRDGEEEEKRKKGGQRQRKEWQEEKDAV